MATEEDDFSFQEAPAMPSAPQSVASTIVDDPLADAEASTRTTAQAKRVVKKAKDTDTSCPFSCGLQKKKGKRFCAPHHKAYENIINGIDNKTDEGKQEWQAFHVIFGNPSDRSSVGIPDLQMKTLDEYNRQFPEGSQKKGVKRGRLALSEFVKAEGTKKCRQDTSERQKMDSEWFENLMKSSRGWSSERSTAFWANLASEPSNVADENGPPWSPTRLFMPPWLLCNERETNVVENYEDHTVKTFRKPECLGRVDTQNLVKDAQTGFSQLAKPNFEAMKSRPSASSKASFSDRDSSNTFLTDVAAQQGVAVPTCSPSKNEADLGLDATGDGKSSIGTEFDLGTAKISKSRILNKDCIDLRKKLETTFAKGTTATSHQGLLGPGLAITTLQARLGVLQALKENSIEIAQSVPGEPATNSDAEPRTPISTRVSLVEALRKPHNMTVENSGEVKLVRVPHHR